jgi:peptidoglycan/LPS O-acetylase OafA/YrhL
MVALAVSLVASKLSCDWIEAPTIRWGRSLAGWWQNRREKDALNTAPVAAD